MRIPTAAALLTFLAGCAAGNAPAEPSSASSLPDSVRPNEAEAQQDGPHGAPIEIDRVAFVSLEAREAEDGAGHTVLAPQPIAIEIRGRHLGGRAFDPVLEAGALRFVHYDFVRPSVLRFVVSDVALVRGTLTLAIGADRRELPPPTIEDEEHELAR